MNAPVPKAEEEVGGTTSSSSSSSSTAPVAAVPPPNSAGTPATTNGTAAATAARAIVAADNNKEAGMSTAMPMGRPAAVAAFRSRRAMSFGVGPVPANGPASGAPSSSSSPAMSPSQWSRRQSIFGDRRGPSGLPTRRRLSIREEATVREVFDIFDEDGKDAISRDEVAIVIQSLLDEESSDEELAGMVDLIETDEGKAAQSISFDVFRSHLECVMGQKAIIDAGFEPCSDIDGVGRRGGFVADGSGATPGSNRKGSLFGGRVLGFENKPALSAEERAFELRLRDKWLRLGGVIALAAQANGEINYRGGLTGAFIYRKRQFNKEVRKQKMNMKHHDVVTHFQLRRLSVDARDAQSHGVVRHRSKDYSSAWGRLWSGGSALARWLSGAGGGERVGDSGGDGAGGSGGDNESVVAKAAAAQQQEEEEEEEVQHERRALRHSSIFGPWHPDATWRQSWSIAIMAIVAVQAIYVPFVVAFQPDMESLGWKLLDYIVDGLFILDILITFNTALYLNDAYHHAAANDDDGTDAGLGGRGQLIVTNRWTIACRYFTGWFLVDLMASMPSEVVIFVILLTNGGSGGGGGGGGDSSSSGAEALSLAKGLRLPRLLRLLRMARLTRFFRLAKGKVRRDLTYFFYYSAHANWLKLGRLLFTILLLCHYMACLLFVASSGLWFRLTDCDGVPCTEADTSVQYVTAFYTIFLLINGEETEPRTDGERIFAIFAILMGSIMVATIFGNVSIIIMNFTANQYAYRKKMESLYENMNCLSLPQGLRARIVDYYDQMWRNYRSLDGQVAMFVPELNKTLASEILLYMRTAMVMNVPFFVQCSPAVIKEFVMNLDTEVYLCGDYILHKGVPGKEMYLISRGKCEVTNNFIRRESTLATCTTVGGNEDTDGGDRVRTIARGDTVESASSDCSGTSKDGDHKEEDEEGDEAMPAKTGRLGAMLKKHLPTHSKVLPFYDHASSTGQHVKQQQAALPGIVNGASSATNHIHQNKLKDRPKNNGNKEKEKDALVAVERVMGVLPRGAHFGELALVTNARRGCNVRARTFCEIQILRRDVFDGVLARYPDERRVVKALLLRRCNQEEIRLAADVRGSCMPLAFGAERGAVGRLDVRASASAISGGGAVIPGNMSVSNQGSNTRALVGEISSRLNAVETRLVNFLEMKQKELRKRKPR